MLDKDSNINPYFTRKNKKKNINSFLFNEKRLDEKFLRFKLITYPSIIKQISKHYTWLIYSSSRLPEKYKQQLLAMKSPRIKIIFVDNFKEMGDHIETHLKGEFSTTRLDDDDGLHPAFLKQIAKYKDKTDAVISMPNGTRVKIQKGHVVPNADIHYKRIATGMTGIGFNIYTAGNHLQVHKKRKVIYDMMEHAYIVYCSEYAGNSRRSC